MIPSTLLIPYLVWLIIFIGVLIYFRNTRRLHYILLVFLVYVLVPINENEFHMCKYKRNNDNHLNIHLQRPIECIHSSKLNSSRDTKNQDFCFTTSILSLKPGSTMTISDIAFYNDCHNKICYTRLDNDGNYSPLPHFKMSCNKDDYHNYNNDHDSDINEIQIDSYTGSFYNIGNDKNNQFSFIVTKPVINNLDNDGYFIFMLSYILFIKEIVFNENSGNPPLLRRLLSFIIFTILFLIPSIFFITVKQRNNEFQMNSNNV